MKILHTSDWHIGKQLHKIDLSEDLELFFNWLLKTIEKEEIDLLLVSGDIFDQANPSQAALKQYYGFLKKMIGTDCKVIITGGNHDSAAVLNAPKEILEMLDVTVVGGALEKVEELFIPVNKGDKSLVVAAVPFLKDKDIRKSVSGESYSDKIEQIREGLKAYFFKINEYYSNSYLGTPFIVMGHLYVQGAQTSDSMRDIQIGNQAGIEEWVFGSKPDYVALGHIHKPYVVSNSKKIHYSGSPISLSFSEKEDIKQVNLITTKNNVIDVEILSIPKFRNLVAFEGTLQEVITKVNEYNKESNLVSLAEIIINEENENIQTRQELDEFIENHEDEGLAIIKSRLNFTNLVRGASEAFETGINVADVTPMEMFEKKLELNGNDSNVEELKNAFREILEELNL